MGRYFGSVWAGITTVLSVVFALLLFPVIQPKYGTVLSLGYTALGVLVIWAGAVLRADFIFKLKEKKKNGGGS